MGVAILRVYHCFKLAAELNLSFGLDVLKDAVQIHPQAFCKNCYDAMQRKLHAMTELHPFGQYQWNTFLGKPTSQAASAR